MGLETTYYFHICKKNKFMLYASHRAEHSGFFSFISDHSEPSYAPNKVEYSSRGITRGHADLSVCNASV